MRWSPVEQPRSAFPVLSRAGVRTKKAAQMPGSADGVEVPSGPWCQYGTRAPARVPQRGAMTADDSFGRLDDDDYPAYTMGRAAELLGTTQGFLRALGEAHPHHPAAFRGRPPPLLPLPAAHRRPRPGTRRPGHSNRRPPAASSSSKTSSKKPSASTPHTAAPLNQQTRRPQPDALWTSNSVFRSGTQLGLDGRPAILARRRAQCPFGSPDGSHDQPIYSASAGPIRARINEVGVQTVAEHTPATGAWCSRPDS